MFCHKNVILMLKMLYFFESHFEFIAHPANVFGSAIQFNLILFAIKVQ